MSHVVSHWSINCSDRRPHRVNFTSHRRNQELLADNDYEGAKVLRVFWALWGLFSKMIPTWYLSFDEVLFHGGVMKMRCTLLRHICF